MPYFSCDQLDAGVDEKIMLVSRDEQSCLIVSYREVSVRWRVCVCCGSGLIAEPCVALDADQELHRRSLLGFVAVATVAMQRG